MTRHLFISPRDELLPRWREAFPEARLGREAAGHLADLVWWAPAQFDADALAHLQRQLGAATPVVVLATTPRPQEAMQAVSAGARGYCHAYATAAMLAQVALAVLNGGLWLGPELMSTMIGAASRQLLADDTPSASQLDLLTPRERAVAIEVARGATNKEAARGLDITERTVKAHLSAVFEKLGVRDRLQLVLALKDDVARIDDAA
jgi:DNA-binding NarL/FixJ family response regulator